MARKCTISGKSKQFGHRVSHANNKTKHCFDVNLQTRRYFVPELNKTVRLKVSTRTIRTIDKLGVMETVRKYGLDLKQILA